MNDHPPETRPRPASPPASPVFGPVPPGSRLENLGLGVALLLDLCGSLFHLMLFIPRRAAHRARLLATLQESDA